MWKPFKSPHDDPELSSSGANKPSVEMASLGCESREYMAFLDTFVMYDIRA